MVQYPEIASDDLLAIHMEAERLLRWRRLGTEIVYGSIVVCVFGSVICLAQGIANALSGHPWPPPFNSISWTIFVVGALVALAPILGLLLGLVFLAVNQTRITWFSVKRHINDLPARPEPLLYERFGGHRILDVTDSTLHVVKTRFANVTGILRLLAAPFILAWLAGLVFSIAKGGAQGRPGSAAVWITFCLLALGWTVAPASLQWLVEAKKEGPRLSLESVRWFFIRSVTDIAAHELGGFTQRKGKLFVLTEDGRRWPLAKIGDDRLGHWKARRLIAAISVRLGIQT